MATLTGSSIASTYTMLLKMDATGVTSSLQKIEDGDATDSALSVSTVAAAIDATDKFYFDGGSHTYIYESADDILDIYVGGANMIKLTESSTDTVLITGDLTVGVNDTGHDVKFFGATSGAYMLWDESEDDLVLAGVAGIDLAGDIDVDGTANLDNTDIDGTLVVDGSNISLDSTSTLNIDNSNTSNGITIGTATSGVPISIGHTTSETTVNDNLTVTGDLTVNGTTTTINSTTLTVDDKLIELAHSPSGSEGNDSAVDGGGIT